MQRARQVGWITEPDDLSKLLSMAGFTDVSVRADLIRSDTRMLRNTGGKRAAAGCGGLAMR